MRCAAIVSSGSRAENRPAKIQPATDDRANEEGRGGKRHQSEKPQCDCAWSGEQPCDAQEKADFLFGSAPLAAT